MAKELVIVTNENGRRFIKAAGRRIWIETYGLSSSQRFERVYKQLSQPELRQMVDAEQASPRRRRSTLLRLTGRLCKLERDEKMDAIKNTVRPKSRTEFPRRPLHTVPEIEEAALKTFGPNTRTGKPRVKDGSSYRSTLTKRLHKRKEQIEAAAAVRVTSHGPLSRRERDALRKAAGDHFCESPCRICGGSFQGDSCDRDNHLRSVSSLCGRRIAIEAQAQTASTPPGTYLAHQLIGGTRSGGWRSLNAETVERAEPESSNPFEGLERIVANNRRRRETPRRGASPR